MCQVPRQLQASQNVWCTGGLFLKADAATAAVYHKSYSTERKNEAITGEMVPASKKYPHLSCQPLFA